MTQRTLESKCRSRAITILTAAATRRKFCRYGTSKAVNAVPAQCSCHGYRISGVLFYRWDKPTTRSKNKTTLRVYVICWKCGHIKSYTFNKKNWLAGATERIINISVDKFK